MVKSISLKEFLELALKKSWEHKITFYMIVDKTENAKNIGVLGVYTSYWIALWSVIYHFPAKIEKHIIKDAEEIDKYGFPMKKEYQNRW